MKLIELHILQSFPVSCLNRDDVGAPKTATFGGTTRARISSQCLKRAVRLHAKELCPPLFAGERSKLIIEPIAKAAERHGTPAEKAMEASKKLCDELATFDKSAFEKKGSLKVKTLMFLSPAEREEIGKELAALVAESKDAKALDRKIKSAAAKVLDAKLKDAADIALFGRMVATDHSLGVEGAAMFSHALSTHKADNDIDFFTAVDDRQKEDPTVEEEDRAGSGMMGSLEFTSAVYYRYVGLNLDLLYYQKDNDGKPTANLACFLGGEHLQTRKNIVDAFLRSSILAVPGARKNSMNANTDVDYVLGIVKDKGQPLQLVNAFEEARRSKNGLVPPSVKAELLRLHRVKSVFSPSHVLELATGMYEPKLDEELKGDMIPRQVSLDDFCKEIVAHVI